MNNFYAKSINVGQTLITNQPPLSRMYTVIPGIANERSHAMFGIVIFLITRDNIFPSLILSDFSSTHVD